MFLLLIQLLEAQSSDELLGWYRAAYIAYVGILTG